LKTAQFLYRRTTMRFESCHSLIKLVVAMAIFGVCSWGAPAKQSDPQQAGEDARAQQALTQARQLATELADEVRALLFKELEKGGYVGAVRACSEAAQENSDEFTTRTGHYARRVSLGYRNPKNSPDGYERQRLEEFDRLNREKKLDGDYFEAVREEGREYLRYMKPLVAGPMCVTCHGQKENIPAEVRAILAEKYPDDRATGYRAGDVRGAISVKIALPAHK
jgi:hypothetical protein